MSAPGRIPADPAPVAAADPLLTGPLLIDPVPADLLREYLLLALRLDRLLPGLVEAAAVAPELRLHVAAEPRPSASDLVRGSGRLLDRVGRAGLDPQRREFLAGQLRAVECTARRLTGQSVSFAREIRECFDVAVAPGEPDRYRDAHRELAELLPGRDQLGTRLARYRAGLQVPPDRLEAAATTLAALLRGRLGAQLPLPAGETVAFRVVPDAPWAALHRYRGGYRSRVLLNAGARPRRDQIAQLVAHEAYPGHHTERCRKELVLIGAGHDEHRVVIANSPSSLIAEGAAELGPAAVLGAGWGSLVAAALAEVGLGFDGELAERVHAATSRLARVRLDAALLLHDARAPAEQAVDHLQRWLLVDERRARQQVRFLQHPVWRAYSVTYVDGAELLRRWWDRAPGPSRLRSLLDEPWIPCAIRAELKV